MQPLTATPMAAPEQKARTSVSVDDAKATTSAADTKR